MSTDTTKAFGNMWRSGLMKKRVSGSWLKTEQYFGLAQLQFQP